MILFGLGKTIWILEFIQLRKKTYTQAYILFYGFKI